MQLSKYLAEHLTENLAENLTKNLDNKNEVRENNLNSTYAQNLSCEVTEDLKSHTQKLRQSLLKKRRALTKEEIQSATQAVLQELLAHTLLQNLNSKCLIASYSSLKGELSTTTINQKLRERGFLVALPKVITPSLGLMDFFACDENSLISGAYGIMEPDLNKASIVSPKDLALMLVPLVGFDDTGNRIGMGGGFYDRYLKRLKPQCVLIGLAYDFQQVAHISAKAHDMPLDEIITPTQHLVFKRKW